MPDPSWKQIPKVGNFRSALLGTFHSAFTKPGALRNGAPFKEWELPPAMRRVQHRLGRVPDGDRQMVDILGAALTDGLDAVEDACAEALSECASLNSCSTVPRDCRPLGTAAPCLLHFRPFAKSPPAERSHLVARANCRRYMRPFPSSNERRLMVGTVQIVDPGAIMLAGVVAYGGDGADSFTLSS